MMSEKKIELLLIEDDEVDREAVHRLLDFKYLVQDASTGNQALGMFRLHRPDGVLLDYRLPDGDGLQFLSVFAEEEVPVVILTGEESPEVIVEAMKQGAQDYLVKGQFTRASLDKAITNAIEKIALKRDLAEKQRKLAEQAVYLEEKNREIRMLASELTLAEQRERRRISQFLHDSLQQTLYGLRVRTHLIQLDAPDELMQKSQEHFQDMDQLINQAIDSIRTLTIELSPPVLKGEGLDVAFEWLAVQMRELHNLNIELKFSGNCRVASEDLRVLVFQLARELLFNVVKHAGVNQAKLEMFEQNGQLVIHIKDEGVGFDVGVMAESQDHRTGFGLYSVRERLSLFGGRLEIESKPGQGTQMTILVPKVPKPS
jgi:signal transduction histidine kinase